jgi:flagellar motor switch protein FliG
MNDTTIHLRESGIRKAAILVTSLDAEVADAILRQLPAEQAMQVQEAAAMLGEIDADERQRIIDEFLRIGPMVPDQSPAGIDLDASHTATRNLSERRNDPDADRHSRYGRTTERDGRESPLPLAHADYSADEIAEGPPFQFLQEADDDKLSDLLQSERPQTVALVLSHLPNGRAGGVLSHFPPHLQVEILRRLADLEETDPVVLREVERALETRLSKQFAMQRRRIAGLDAIVGILDACDNKTSGRILENLAACDRSLAEKLGLQSITFDDLASLDGDLLVSVFKTVDPVLAQTALIGAVPALVERVLATLSPREAKRIRKQLNHPGPLRLSDVEDARQQIAGVAQRILNSKKKSASAA